MFVSAEKKKDLIIVNICIFQIAPVDGAAHIDLKCKEKVTDSDTESQSDVESAPENRGYSQQRYSPVKTGSDALRLKPSKISRYFILLKPLNSNVSSWFDRFDNFRFSLGITKIRTFRNTRMPGCILRKKILLTVLCFHTRIRQPLVEPGRQLFILYLLRYVSSTLIPDPLFRSITDAYVYISGFEEHCIFRSAKSARNMEKFS